MSAPSWRSAPNYSLENSLTWQKGRHSLTLGGSAEYYVSFDNTVVGELQGQGLADCLGEDISELKLLQEHIHDAVGTLIRERTGRRPMILPVVLEV